MEIFLLVVATSVLVVSILGLRKQLREYKDPPVVYENRSEMAKARSRDPEGKFLGDDPKTETNEAFKNGRRGRKKKNA